MVGQLDLQFRRRGACVREPGDGDRRGDLARDGPLSLSSMRALCAMVIPLLYSKLFNLGQRLNVPGLPFYGVLFFTLAKDLMERSLPAELKR